jgi:hypothetical protein
LLKFALMQLHWEFRKDETTAVHRFWYQESGVLHEMAFNLEGEMVLHRIADNRLSAADNAVTKGFRLSPEIPYALIPEAFQDAQTPEAAVSLRKIQVEGGYCIVFEDGNTLPVALPLFVIGQGMCKGKNHFVLLHVAQKKVTVAAFSEQKPLLLNTFPAGNEAEALYFALAPFQRAGIAETEVDVAILADKESQASLMQLFERFTGRVSPCPVALPYQVGEYPPFADISLLLFTLFSCGLPEEP